MEVDFADCLAASLIAATNFPRVDTLPRLVELPFNNLGHMPLIDFERLRTVVWSAAWELMELAQQHRRRRRRSIALALLVLIATGSPIYWMMYSMGSMLGPTFLLAPLLAWLAYAATRPNTTAAVARAKAAMIQALLAGQLPPSVGRYSERYGSLARSRFSRGLVSRDSTLVFLSGGPNDLFPGLGWDQFREVLHFPVKTDHEARVPEHSQLEDLVQEAFEAARRMVTPSSLLCEIGTVVTIDRDTIHTTCPWIDESGLPLLEVQDADALDKAGLLTSVARFRALQVLMPAQNTLVTFVARAFHTGTSICMEVAIYTLGPPSAVSARSRIELEENVLQHLRVRDLTRRERLGFLVRRFLAGWRARRMSAIAQGLDAAITGLMTMDDPLTPFVSADVWDEIHKLGELADRETRAADELASLTGRWPGHWTRQANWREFHSLTMTDDPFRAVECRGSIRGLYAYILRVVLDAADKLGYDVNDYRGDRGQVMINSDQIENLVVGESISIARRDKKKLSRSRRSAATQSAETST